MQRATEITTLTFESEPHVHCSRTTSFNHVSLEHRRVCLPLVRLRRVAAGCEGQTSSSAPQVTRILAFRPLGALTANTQHESSISVNDLDPTHRRKRLNRGQRCASLVLLLPAPGLLVSPPRRVPTLAAWTRPFASPFSFLSLSSPFPLPLLPQPFLPFSRDAFSLARCSSVGTCHEPCAAQDRLRFSVPVSSLARGRARFGQSHDLPRERLSRDHGELLERVPSRLPPEPIVGDLRLRRFCAGPRPSPGCKHLAKVASLTVHLLPSGARVEDASQKRCRAMSTFPLALILEHSPRFESMASRNQRNHRKNFTFTLCDGESMSCPTH